MNTGDPVVWYMAQGYPVSGGHEAHILHYASELRKHGFSTRVVVPDPLPAMEHRFLRFLRERGIPIESIADSIRFRNLAVLWIFLVPWMLRQALRGGQARPSNLLSYIRSRMIARELKRKIQRESPDVIHIFGRLAHNLWDVLPPERVVFHHATEGRLDKSWEPSEIDVFSRFANKAACNLAPGSGVVANVRRDFGVTAEIITVFTICPDEAVSQLSVSSNRSSETVLESFVDNKERITNNFTRRKRRLRFGILCRFTEEKGISYLLDALKEYRDKHGTVDFTFAGQGELEGMIRNFISDFRLTSVRIVRVDRPVDILMNMDVFVHPSVTDAMPVAIAEALMAGCPCVVSRVGGIPDLIRDGVEGFVIEPRTAAQILECMERFMQMSEEELADFSRRARARYEEVCMPDKIGRQVAGYYRKIISHG